MLFLMIAFWLCLGALAWTYLVYPFGMIARAALARWRSTGSDPDRPVDLPKVTIVVAARNSQERLEPRIHNLLSQSYPEDRLSVVLVLNGCTDDSERVATELAKHNPRMRALTSPAEDGKAGALNRGVALADGEAIVFADVRQTFRPDAIRRLVRALVQPGVGAVTGRLVIRDAESAAFEGTGQYWAFETRLRLAESRTGSVMGATGAIYAVWKRLYVRIPPGTILDDVFLPLSIARNGHAVRMVPEAVAEDEPTRQGSVEYGRRVRTLLGNLQLVRLLPGILVPWKNDLFIRFVSHKLLRVYTPLFMLGLIGSGALLGGLVFGGIALTASLLCVAGLVGIVVPSRPLALPAAFLVVQVAALEAIFRRRRSAADVWTP